MAFRRQKSQESGAIIGGKPPKNRRLIVAGLIVLVIAIIAAVGLYVRSRTDEVSSSCNKSSNSPIYTEAGEVMGPDQTAELEKVVTKIQSQPNYEKDPNCLIPVVQFYIFKSDIEKADEFYGKLEKEYKTDADISPAYSAYNPTLNNLRLQLDAAKAMREQLKQNVKYF